jgi:mRNA interferase MazF
MNKFDLYWFDYVNQDGTKKTRPVLLLEEGIILPIAEVTSHDTRTDKDYKIVKWQEAGLTKPSTIRFDKIQFATSSLLKDNIGHLDQEDIDKIEELKLVEKLMEDIEKHDALNPVLFDGEELKPEIKEAIEKIVDTFIKELREDNIKFNLKDIVLVGSNVSYNYTKDSDLDIHIIADSEGLECPDDLYPLLYSAYRSIFNKNYDINIKGIPAEIYVEVDKPAGISNGIYSLKDGWVKKPEVREIPDLDKEAFDKLFKEWEEKYNLLLKQINEELSDDIYNFIEDLYDLRKESIAKDGEYSLGNLVFKEFRNRGYLDNLKDLRKEEKSKELSLESLTEEQDYEAKLNEYKKSVIEDYCNRAQIGAKDITEDNLNNEVLIDVSCLRNYDINDLKELLLRGN